MNHLGACWREPQRGAGMACVPLCNNPARCKHARHRPRSPGTPPGIPSNQVTPRKWFCTKCLGYCLQISAITNVVENGRRASYRDFFPIMIFRPVSGGKRICFRHRSRLPRGLLTVTIYLRRLCSINLAMLFPVLPGLHIKPGF